jgi:tight adherence protein C
MTMLTFIVLAFVLVGGLTFAVGAVLLRLLPAFREERLAALGASAGSASASILRWREGEARDWRGAVERLGRRITPRDALGVARYSRRLVKAGFHDPRAVPLFLGAKAVLGLLGVLSYMVYGVVVQRALPHVLPVCLMLGVTAFFLPDLWLGARIRDRRHAVQNALPDVLDLLMVCVEAGMGFDAAVARVAEQPEMRKSPLHHELLRMHLEVRAGRPREEAFRAFSERIDTEDVRSMVSAFIQTEKLGTSLGRTLRVQSDASRVQRRHRAETKAQLAPLMMLLPTVVFLMPAFMLVAMAPSLLKMLQIMNTIGK